MKPKSLTCHTALLFSLLVFFITQTFGQIPSITYSGAQSFQLGVPITALTPSNTGGAVYAMGQTLTFAGVGSPGAYDGTGTGAAFNHPIGVAVDGAGNVYVADRLNYKIRKITPGGTVSTLAGSGSAGFANGFGSSASFNLPNSVSVDAGGNVYVADEYNNMIRAISPSGGVSTLAGSGTPGYLDGTGANARFYNPFGAALDGAGNLYVADYMNGMIRKVTPAGVVSTLAGGFGTVLNVACDLAGYVYVADAGSHVIYKVTPTGNTTVFAGSGYAGSANGSGTSATFNHPAGLAVDVQGNVYVGDEVNNQIRKITPGGIVTTIAGNGSAGSNNSAGTSASFYYPCGVAIDDASGSLYVADYSNNMIRKVVVGPYSISPALPAGLVFDNATGTISGTPTALANSFTYTVTARNGFGAATYPLSLSVSNGGSNPGDENYVLTFTPRVPINDITQLPNHSVGDVNQSITYLDGLGRPKQNVLLKGSAAFNDIVQPISYDQFGREITKYLPYAPSSGNPLSYRGDALQPGAGQASFYASPPAGVSAVSFPSAQTLLEASPLNRVMEQGAPGAAWQPAASRTTGANATGRTVVTEYALNAAYEALLWTPNGNGATAGWYTPNTLYKTISKDENWVSGKIGTIEEFKDFDGHVILKRIWETETNSLSTYYVYDDYNNLAYVVPPAVSATGFTEAASDAAFTNFIYAYHYDSRNRLVEKKQPGKGWEYIVYNKLDQVIFTQDGIQRGKSPQQWTFTKYDGLGRVALTGVYNDDQHGGQANTNYRSDFQNIAYSSGQWETRDNSNTVTGYSNSAMPQGSISAYLTMNYYDDYNVPGNPYGTWNPTMAYPTGLPVATKTAILNPDGTVNANMLWATTFYDNLGRVAQTSKQHYLGGDVNFDAGNYDVEIPAYDFTNAVTAHTRWHIVHNSITLTVANNYDYDQMGRKLKTWESINGAYPATLLSQTEYNDVGQLYKKHLHSVSGSPFLQDITYSYNERGWLTHSNSGYFDLQLRYNSTVRGAAANWNGNIAEQEYTKQYSGNQWVNYSYDALNRLTGGNSSEGLSETYIGYDNMGNITQLTRGSSYYGYNYLNGNSNQLQNVPGLTSGYYSYDANGNMGYDARNSTGVTYNVLNLPATMPGKGISYTYDALGRKLSRTYNGVTTYYIDGIQYTGGTIDFVQTEEGRVNNPTTSPNYEYTLTDHLGNNRVSFDQVSGKVGEEDYYPFGWNVDRQLNAGNKYLYNKKELQDGLNGQLDYGARFYDPVIARWTTIDPLAELGRRFSPYNYVENNPLRNIDPDGMWKISPNGYFTEDPAEISSVIESLQSGQKGGGQDGDKQGKQKEVDNKQQVINNKNANQGGDPPSKWQQFKDGVANDATMFQLWFGFLSGLGDKSKIYMNDRVAREMQQSAGITKATNDYYKNGITQGHYDFGVPGLKAAGFNPIQQFVGSYDYSISANLEGGFLQFTLTNTTSFASGALHIPPYSWNWNSGPMGNTYQTFIFTQSLRK